MGGVEDVSRHGSDLRGRPGKRGAGVLLLGLWGAALLSLTCAKPRSPSPAPPRAAAAPSAEEDSEEPLPYRAPGVTPPKQVYDVRPRWPPGSRPHSALAVLDVVITKQGTVRILGTRQSDDAAWERACRQAIAQWRYQPATKGSRPVAIHSQITCNINVR